MADNYLGNKMDDYRSGRLNQRPARKVTPGGHRPGSLRMAINPSLTVWIGEGSLLEAGQHLIRLLAESGVRVCYRAESGKVGSEPAIRFGAKHYPPTAEAPKADAEVNISEERIALDGDRGLIAYGPERAEAAAQLAATLLTDSGRSLTRANIII